MKIIKNIENRLFKYYKEMDHKKIIIGIFIFLCVYSSFLLLIPGIPRGHDLTFHLSRISAITDGLKLGEFPVRVYPNYFGGYGYANGLFYGDIFLYFPAVLCLLGLSVITSYKVFLFVCAICTALSSYICVKFISKSKFAATLAMILYTLSSYRAVDVYIRAAIGEVLAFIFIPIVILGLYEIIYNNKKKWYIITIGFTGLFLSHNISAVIMAGFTALILIISYKKILKEPNRLGYLTIAAIVTILLTSFFLIPMVEQLLTDKFVVNTQTVDTQIWTTTMPLYKIIFEVPYSLLFLPGVSGIGIVFLVVVFLRFKIKSDKSEIFKFSDICFGMGIISLLAVTKIFPWKIIIKVIKQLAAIQLAWRLYLFATLFLSISGGIVILRYCKNIKTRIKISSIILVLSIFACSINMFAQYLFYGIVKIKGLHDVSIEPYRIGLGEYLPEGTNKNEFYKRGDIITSNNNIEVEFERKGTNLDIEFSNNYYDDTYIELPLIYYLGYEVAYYNGDEKNILPISRGNNNIIRVDLQGYDEGKILVNYKGTRLQKITQYISCISLILFIIYLFYSNNNWVTLKLKRGVRNLSR